MGVFEFLSFGESVKAFFAEFRLLAIAGACVVSAIALLSIRVAPALLERWTGLDALKRIVAYTLFGIAIGCLCWFGGYRSARHLSVESELRRQIAERDVLIAEQQRQAQAARTIAEAAADRVKDAETKSADLQTKVDSYAEELAKRPNAACSLGPADLRWLQSINGSADPARAARGAAPVRNTRARPKTQ